MKKLLFDRSSRVSSEEFVVRYDLADALLDELALQELDEDVSGHGIELDASGTKECNFVVACTMRNECF